MTVSTALVTGAAGFVGRNITRALADAGYLVDAIDIDPDVIELAGYNIAHAATDARSFFASSRDRYDVVVHAAAVVGGRLGIELAPAELAATDLELDGALWRWALRTRPGRVVYLSSSAAYPIELQTTLVGRQLTEADLDPAAGTIGAPDNTYGWVKLVGERIAVDVRRAGVPVTVVRPFSGYGPDQALDYPFPTFIARARKQLGQPGHGPFPVWGDGTQVRDFIHIRDICAAIIALVDDEVDGPVNLGTGRPVSFNELARLVSLAAGGQAPELAHELDKPVGVRYRVADPTRLHTTYRPEVDLVAGITEALELAETAP